MQAGGRPFAILTYSMYAPHAKHKGVTLRDAPSYSRAFLRLRSGQDGPFGKTQGMVF